jgi:hypothetical protein
LLHQEPIKRSSIVGPNLENVRIDPGHPMALENIGKRRDLPRKLVEVLGMPDTHANESGDVLAQPLRVDPGDIRLDDALVFKFADPISHGRLRQLYSLGNLLLSDAGIPL